MSTISFSPREVEVIRLLAAGHNFPEIGKRLGLSVRTIQSYAESARKKLGVRSARELPEAYKAETGENPYPSVEGHWRTLPDGERVWVDSHAKAPA